MGAANGEPSATLGEKIGDDGPPIDGNGGPSQAHTFSPQVQSEMGNELGPSPIAGGRSGTLVSLAVGSSSAQEFALW